MYIFFSFREEQKHLKRASVVIGVIATVIFLLCVAMVAVTLHFTPVMNQLASKYPFFIFIEIGNIQWAKKNSRDFSRKKHFSHLCNF